MVRFAHAQLGGRTYPYVALCPDSGGRWPSEVGDHRIDAVNFPDHPRPASEPVAYAERDTEPEHEIASAVTGAAVNLVAADKKANRLLFGLLVGAADIFSHSYPEHGLLRLVAVVDHAEPNISWVYRRAGIQIIERGSA